MQDSFSRLATSACVGTHSHELWLDLVMRKRRSSTVMREWLSLTVPSLSPPATLCVAHYPFPVVLPLFQRGSIFFKPVFVNLTWSAVNKSICALESNCWCWILSHFTQHNRYLATSSLHGDPPFKRKDKAYALDTIVKSAWSSKSSSRSSWWSHTKPSKLWVRYG